MEIWGPKPAKLYEKMFATTQAIVELIEYDPYSEVQLSTLLPEHLIQSVNCSLTQLIIRRFFPFLLCCTHKSLL